MKPNEIRNLTAEEIEDDAPLFQEGLGLDSIAALELATRLGEVGVAVGQLRHAVPRQLLIVEPLDQPVRNRQVELLGDAVEQRRRRSSPIKCPDSLADGGMTEPEGRSLVTEQLPPAPRA